MDVHLVDKRDATQEARASGFRVTVLEPGRVTSYNIDRATVAEAQLWAIQHRGSRGYALAARIDGPQGVDLVWLTAPPEALA
ncbi:hypothetical protein D1781_14700 [Amnibacterium setariae]|uniref:Uncharacterized protein n=1 Tax=Amnibacterium setariae TaxID=2306585 RepID=A0A3A1TY10_9MICO|nr:hypothetical protein D1781_14700 [Amnibacterium setariae]